MCIEDPGHQLVANPARALSAPCFDAVRDLARLLVSPAVEDIDRALGEIARVRFVPGRKRRRRRRPDRPIPQGELYEVRIAATREVPTRADNLHDLFNALSWAAFPRSKWALTERLAHVQRARLDQFGWRLPGSRTRLHDRLALLDEGGVLIAGEVADRVHLATALAAGRARALVFGHALLEHALTDRFDVAGLAVTFPIDPAAPLAVLRCALDRALAASLAQSDFPSPDPGWPSLSLATLAQINQ